MHSVVSLIVERTVQIIMYKSLYIKGPLSSIERYAFTGVLP